MTAQVRKDLATINPSLVKEWHPRNNGDLSPSDVSYGSNYRAWWVCSNCGYEWQTTVKARAVNGNGCPVCANRVVWIGHNDLTTTNPNLALEWHPTLNGNTKPSAVTAGSNRKIWWLCPECGHEWQAVIASRSEGHGCPVCCRETISHKKSKPAKGCNLSEKEPELTKEWNYKKNDGLDPKDISFKSHRKVWWICSKCNYEWEATPHARSSGNGCPACSNKIAWPGHNDLATLYPNLALEWHPTFNESLKPDNVTSGSGQTVWWLGKCGHVWRAKIYSRVCGSGCPVCISANQTSFGEKAIYYYLRTTLGDDEVIPNYRPAGWGRLELDIFLKKCRVAIEYDGPFHSRLSQIDRDKRKNQLCKQSDIRLIRIRYPDLPILSDCECYNLPDITNDSIKMAIEFVFETIICYYPYKQPMEIDLEKDGSFILEDKEKAIRNRSISVVSPELLKEWHPTKNGKLSPDNISYGSNYKIWWLCSRCGYEWLSTVVDRSSGHGCPYCSNKVVRDGYNDLATLNPELAKQWHPTKNGVLSPHDVTPYSNQKIWWLCPVCEYEWQSLLSVRSNGNGCPACSRRSVRSGYNDLATLNPELAKQWHPTKNINLNTNDLTPGSNKKVWWLCPKCGYEWQTSPKERSHGKGCPACSGRATWKGHNDLATLYPELAKQWHPVKNGDITPDSIRPGSDYQAWWICDKCGYEWKAPVYNRTHGSGCMNCYKMKNKHKPQ